MIKEVKIQNYKSVQDLSLELGRVNVLIGANGCGKSNILEAIAMGSAAADNKLSNEFLSSRGIRVTEPRLMKSGFTKELQNQFVQISFDSIELLLKNEGQSYSKWEVDIPFFSLNKKKIRIEVVNNKNDAINLDELLEYFNDEQKSHINDNLSLMFFKERNVFDFLVYTPENTSLRNFEQETQIEPLGIKGEGLFKLLSVMSSETPEEFQELIENLELIDWFEGFEIPKDLVFTERRIRIKDRFLEDGLKYFDQRSSNEGFLYLMFYFALFISKYTPKFFAIDNIDASLNPKLCSELIKILTKLAKKHDKQVIFTTHNPAILDGLNLNDDEQRLMVVYRNVHGHTKTKRITKKETPEGSEPVRLSEQFLRGYLGGLPNNF